MRKKGRNEICLILSRKHLLVFHIVHDAVVFILNQKSSKFTLRCCFSCLQLIPTTLKFLPERRFDLCPKQYMCWVKISKGPLCFTPISQGRMVMKGFQMISWNAGVWDQCLKVTTIGKMKASPGNGPVVPAEAPLACRSAVECCCAPHYSPVHLFVLGSYEWSDSW